MSGISVEYCAEGNPLAQPANPAVDLAIVGTPIPKGPPASMAPTSFEAQAARPPSPRAAAAQPLPKAQSAQHAAEIQMVEVDDYYAKRRI